MMQQGRVFTHPAFARQRFREIVGRPEPPLLNLVEASLVIDLEDRPGVDIDRYLQQVGEWSDAVRERLEGSQDVERIVDGINALLFRDEGFHGENEDYYDPRSALLSETLDRHAGLPITLSILYIELSRRLSPEGMDVAGISLPGRFLVKFSGAFGQIVVDPFDGGRVLSHTELQKILDATFGGGVRLREHHLRSFTRREILARELAHLKSAYLAQHDLARAAASIDRLLILDDHDAYEVKDRASVAMQMHAYGQAIECLERYLALMPHAGEAPRIREQVAYLRAWIEQN
jgi:regulator of sirC expression with transglutaminase-like and TPR domain